MNTIKPIQKDLESLCDVIENMDNFHQKEILKIFEKNNKVVSLNENKNGVLINLSDVPHDIIDEISNYIKHVNTQECELSNDEEKKQKLKNDYF